MMMTDDNNIVVQMPSLEQTHLSAAAARALHNASLMRSSIFSHSGIILLPQHARKLLSIFFRSNNNNNNNPICKAPECQKTSVALADRNSRAN